MGGPQKSRNRNNTRLFSLRWSRSTDISNIIYKIKPAVRRINVSFNINWAKLTKKIKINLGIKLNKFLKPIKRNVIIETQHMSEVMPNN
mgnify:CR=1 FL=1